MSAYKEDIGVFVMESLELFGDECAGWVARWYAAIQVSTDEDEVWPIVKGEVDDRFEASLKVTLTFEPSGTILDR